ncbi:hypothetical protein [Candidatus Reidiella endopervernicosa]|uniref:Uncharacterized protein n=1 Tax=Candidatus Reidiella endopervernicosa TaxID=2738883 RepID=A0A6N0HS01_9GAMM|nr:hypothetical protein [Candidatus Reidiella endopervernicosa]QKQ25056.1 hypothetical protein HUE57_01200 [Candidatus Reidiella endopervernicosa]
MPPHDVYSSRLRCPIQITSGNRSSRPQGPNAPPPPPPKLGSGSRYFAEACFGHPSPSKRQILNATRLCLRRPTSCVRCVITSSRLYTTPSVTLRRHKAAAASSSSFARALNYE